MKRTNRLLKNIYQFFFVSLSIFSGVHWQDYCCSCTWLQWPLSFTKGGLEEWMRPPVTESGTDKRSQNLWCRRNEEEDKHWYVLIIWCSHMFLSFYFQGTETEAQSPSSPLDDYSDGCLWPSKLEGNGISDPCWDRYLPNLIQLHARHSNF